MGTGSRSRPVAISGCGLIHRAGRLVRSLDARQKGTDSRGRKLREAPESNGVHFHRRPAITILAPMTFDARQPVPDSAVLADEYLFLDVTNSHDMQTASCEGFAMALFSKDETALG